MKGCAPGGVPVLTWIKRDRDPRMASSTCPVDRQTAPGRMSGWFHADVAPGTNEESDLSATPRSAFVTRVQPASRRSTMELAYRCRNSIDLRPSVRIPFDCERGGLSSTRAVPICPPRAADNQDQANRERDQVLSLSRGPGY